MAIEIEVNTITEAHIALGLPEPKHPLVSVIKNDEVENIGYFNDTKVILKMYSIVFKKGVCGDLKYGVSNYDFQSGTLLFTAPNQVIQYDNINETKGSSSEGWNLIFHPDLIRKSNMSKKIKEYSFFEYRVNEGLHLSENEKETIEVLVDKIVQEYEQALDKHSQHLINLNIELLLDYCVRFYDRQFYSRSNLNSDIVSKFEHELLTYYEAANAIERGMPSVLFFANVLNKSPNYLSDLLKKATGKTAQEHIHLFIINQAKNKLLSSKISISEIGYQLGFEYPQYFSNLFKSKTGFSPKEYRSLN